MWVLGPVHLLPSARPEAAVNSGLTSEKNPLPTIRCRQELILLLIAEPALVLPLRTKLFYLLHLGQTRIERSKSNAL